jgi:hypothetical protein
VQHILLHETQLLVERHAGRRGVDDEAAAIDLAGGVLHEPPSQAAPLQLGLHQQHADDGVVLAIVVQTTLPTVRSGASDAVFSSR